MRRFDEAFEMLGCIIKHAAMRYAMVSWTNASRRLSWQNAVLERRVSIVRRRLTKQVLLAWREASNKAFELRRRYFLMMLLNRWRLYTEECIDLRQMRYTALVYWATVKCAKAFAALKTNAEQSKKEKKHRTSLHSSSAIKRLGCDVGDMGTIRGQRHVQNRSVTPSTRDSRYKCSSFNANR